MDRALVEQSSTATKPNQMSVGVWITGYLLLGFACSGEICNHYLLYAGSTLYLLLWLVRTLLFVIQVRRSARKVPLRICAGAVLAIAILILTSLGAYKSETRNVSQEHVHPGPDTTIMLLSEE